MGRCWGHTMGGTCLQGCPHPFAYRGLFWREEGAALGRVTPWWSLSAETVTGSSVAGTRQARGNQGLHSPMGQKSDKDEFWKVQRDNGKGCVSEPFVPAGPLCRHWLGLSVRVGGQPQLHCRAAHLQPPTILKTHGFPQTGRTGCSSYSNSALGSSLASWAQHRCATTFGHFHHTLLHHRPSLSLRENSSVTPCGNGEQLLGSSSCPSLAAGPGQIPAP